MSIFADPADEDRLCHALKAYVEEWGPENVVVSVPKHWQNYSPTWLGKSPSGVFSQAGCFDTLEFPKGHVHCHIEIQLQQGLPI